MRILKHLCNATAGIVKQARLLAKSVPSAINEKRRQIALHSQVTDQLKHLHGLTAITAAEVVLEHQREAKPGFRVQVRLEVPGPGLHPKATRHTRQAALLIHGPALHTEARDNTLEAALLKATQDLEHQLQARQLRRKERGKSKLQLSAVSGRWTHVQAG